MHVACARRSLLALALVACACASGTEGPTDGPADGEVVADDGPFVDDGLDEAGTESDGESPSTLAGTLTVAALDAPLTPVGSARQPEVAFHGAADAFVAAYSWVLPDIPTPRFRVEVRAVTVDAAGTPRASDPLMVDGDFVPHDALDVAVAAPSGGDAGPAFVVWNDDRASPGTAGFLEIYGGLVAVTGGSTPAVAALGAPFVVSDVPGTNESVPAAGWDRTAGVFLAAWGDDRERGVRHEDARVVYARTVAPSGTLGPELRLGDDGLFQTSPQIAACDTGRFLVAWTDYVVEGPTLTSRYRGRLLDGRSGALSDIVTWGEAPGLAQEPFGVACNRRTGGWAAAWTVPGSPSFKQVATAVLAADGTVTAGPTVVTAQADGARSPRLAWLRATNSYVLSPLAQDSTFGYVLELDPEGAAASAPRALTPTAPGLGTHWSAVASHSSRPLALVVMTLDYQRVHATTLLGSAVLP